MSNPPPTKKRKVLKDAICKARYSERDDEKATKFLFRESAAAQFKADAKNHVLNDLSDEEMRRLRMAVQENANNGKLTRTSDLAVRQGAKKDIAEYYGISLRTLDYWSKQRRGSGVEPKPKSGRKKMIDSPIKHKICEVRNQDNGKSERAVASTLKTQTLTNKSGASYETSYKGRKKASPSKSSIRRVIAEGRQFSVKKRPLLNSHNKLVRFKYATNELKLSDSERNNHTVAVDECWFTMERRGTGKLVEHPKGPKITAAAKIRQVKSKRHPPKILVLAAISRPKMVNMTTAGQNEPAEFDPHLNGKVALVRCVEEVKYKRKVYETVNGEKVLKHNAGDTKLVSCTIDAQRYKDFLCRDGGVFSKIQSYYGSDVTVRFQEDGAPGHGYNNRNNRAPTAIHEEMVLDAKNRSIEVFKQPHNSPETNPLDLGIWFALQSKVRQLDIKEPDRPDDSYTESQIWAAVKQAWEQLEPRTIWNCWMVKDEILKELRTSRGQPIVSEPHSGIRKRWGTYESTV